MAGSDQEIEVKFFLRDLSAFEARLQQLGAHLVTGRVHEINLRFDTPDRILQQAHQVLRLRHDVKNVVTFKGPGQSDSGAVSRQEIEYQVDDFEAARRVFEALGYRVSVMYEKFRTTYQFDDLLVTLDEMPYGNFAEIEGAGSGGIEEIVTSIRAASARLQLNWDARITISYMALFDQLRRERNLAVQNLCFAEMQGLTISAQDLDLHYADDL